MGKVGRILLGMAAWTMMLVGGAVAIGFCGLTIAWLARGGGEAWGELTRGDFEAGIWLIFGLVPVVVGGAAFAVGVWMLKVFDRMEEASPRG